MRRICLLLTLTRVAGVGIHRRLSVCLSVCPHDRTNTAENTITKLATGIVNHESLLPIHLILGRKVKGQGHRVTNCKKKYFKRSSGRREFTLYRVARL